MPQPQAFLSRRETPKPAYKFWVLSPHSKSLTLKEAKPKTHLMSMPTKF